MANNGVITTVSFEHTTLELINHSCLEELGKVNIKPNQELKYLNRGSTHTSACFKAIPSGVFGRLAKLTTMTPENANKPLEELYPKHIEVLRKAELIQGPTPTLKQVLDNRNQTKSPKNLREITQKERERGGEQFFSVWATLKLGLPQFTK